MLQVCSVSVSCFINKSKNVFHFRYIHTLPPALSSGSVSFQLDRISSQQPNSKVSIGLQGISRFVR